LLLLLLLRSTRRRRIPRVMLHTGVGDKGIYELAILTNSAASNAAP